MVPERLIPPVEGPLPAAPGDEPEPASFGPVLFAVPEWLEPPELPSAANAVPPRARIATTASSGAFISVLPLTRLSGAWRPLDGSTGNRASVKLFLSWISAVGRVRQPFVDTDKTT